MFKYILSCFIFFHSLAFCNEGKFLLLLGPSGAGKSTIIQHLKNIDSRFTYISPYTTRELRSNETDKIHISLDELKSLENEGSLLTINNIYGIYYATPKNVIDEVLEAGLFPILDWPVDKMSVMLQNYDESLYCIYIEPESIAELKKRLEIDGRDKEGLRFAKGKEELQQYYSGAYDSLINLKILNKNGEDLEAALIIYEKFMESF